MRGHDRAARFAAPAAFLAAATVAIVLVRSGLENGDATSPPAATTAATTTTGGTSSEITKTGPAAEAEFYEIRRGDTLADVAERHGTTVEALLVLNPDVDPVALTIGDRIRVK